MMKRNIGIFLGFAPGELLGNQGIIRLLLNLFHSKEFRNRVVVALPSWCYEDFKTLLLDVKEVQEDDINTILMSKKKSLLLVLGEKLKKLMNTKGLFIKFLINQLRRSTLARSVYKDAKENELDKLIKAVNQRTDIDVWYIPTGFWPETKKINRNKIIAIPDIVYFEFPSLFSHVDFEKNYRSIKESLGIKAHFLCISERVKFEHLVKPFQIEENRISVIKHGLTDLSHYLKSENFDQTSVAKKILEKYEKETQKNPFLVGHCLSNTRFIFYSSQVRPHKNFLNMIKAFEILLRKRLMNIKLVITGDPSHDSSLDSYIIHNRLQHDVVSLYNVKQKVLAALNHLAVLAVNPTIFEGGFPFTFCEAYSVGTPSIMGRIPAFLEESKDENLNSNMLFDPYDVQDMVNKIEWGINHREDLFQLQKPLYEKFAIRSWECAAKDYLNLFDKVAVHGI